MKDGKVWVEPRDDSASGPARCGARRAPGQQHRHRRVRGLHHAARDQRRRLSRRGAGQEPEAAARLQPRRQLSDPGGHQDRLRAADRDHAISGADSQRVGQVAAEIRAFRPPEPYKGKGIKYAGRIRSCARKARRSKDHGDDMSNKRTVPAPSAAHAPACSSAASGRPRLSVFRSSQAHLCPGHRRRAGRTLAAASTSTRISRGKLKTGADKDAAAAVGKLIAERAMAAGRRRGRVRPRRLPVSWPGQGPGRRRPRRRAEILERDASNGTRPQGRGRQRGPRADRDARAASSSRSWSASTASPRW